jgi:hypothetical protein
MTWAVLYDTPAKREAFMRGERLRYSDFGSGPAPREMIAATANYLADDCDRDKSICVRTRPLNTAGEPISGGMAPIARASAGAP